MEFLQQRGKACIITPDGVLENPSYKKLRVEILEKCDVYAIISLPKFAFAPYTKEKTYALFLKKRSSEVTKIQDKPIWMYIIDNDGLANSDKRFPTKLRNNRNGWMLWTMPYFWIAALYAALVYWLPRSECTMAPRLSGYRKLAFFSVSQHSSARI